MFWVDNLMTENQKKIWAKQQVVEALNQLEKQPFTAEQSKYVEREQSQLLKVIQS
jgi:hypothetical protein